jgi:hypothetical protein
MTALLKAAVRAIFAKRVLVFIDLTQDIDVLLPVILALRAGDALTATVRVSRWLERESPRTGALLRACGIPFAYVRRHEVVEGRAPSLRGIAAVIAASESSCAAHAAGHALALRAQAAGLRTYVVQHGLENVGLIGVEAGAASFASGTVFCWFPDAATPETMPSETRAKLAHVGRPEPPGGWAGPPTAQAFDLGVFENLHWDRYSDADRTAFRAGLAATAQALPGARILLRPHPAGAWADGLGHELARFGNITAAPAAQTRRDLMGALEILKGIKRVITTPSTIALDAALIGRPTALAVDGGGLYSPLAVLTSPEDWVRFASSDDTDGETLDLFRSRVLVPGDGAARIAERLHQDLLS